MGTNPIGHRPSNIDGAHVLVTSTAIPKHNVEVVEEHAQYSVIPRAEDAYLELMRMKYGLAIGFSRKDDNDLWMVAMCLVAGGWTPPQ